MDKQKNKFKINEVKQNKIADDILFTQNIKKNNIITKELREILKTNSETPTHTPNKFIDCFYLYYDGSTTYRLYIYINQEWKYINLS